VLHTNDVFSSLSDISSFTSVDNGYIQMISFYPKRITRLHRKTIEYASSADAKRWWSAALQKGIVRSMTAWRRELAADDSKLSKLGWTQQDP